MSNAIYVGPDPIAAWQAEQNERWQREKARDTEKKGVADKCWAYAFVRDVLPLNGTPESLRVTNGGDEGIRASAEQALDTLMYLQLVLDVHTGSWQVPEGRKRIIKVLDVHETINRFADLIFPSPLALQRLYGKLSTFGLIRLKLRSFPSIPAEDCQGLREYLDSLEQEYQDLLYTDIQLSLFPARRSPRPTVEVILLQDTGCQFVGRRLEHADNAAYQLNQVRNDLSTEDEEVLRRHARKRGTDIITATNVSPLLEPARVAEQMSGFYTAYNNRTAEVRKV